MSVRVTITPFDLTQVRGELHFKAMVLGRLKEQGAPVEGTLIPKLERGTLIRTEDFDTGNYIFEWRDDAPIDTTGANDSR